MSAVRGQIRGTGDKIVAVSAMAVNFGRLV